MFTQYFGHFLLNKGLVAASALQSAMESLHLTHVKLGVLSVNAGFMTAAQAAEVHHTQMRMDKRFGEIAIELGYLTEEQLQQLLSAQKESHLLLGQALIDQGTLTIEQFSSALKQYKDEYYLSDDQFDAIKKGDIDTLIAVMLHQKERDGQTWYRTYLSLLAKNLIRFIDPQVYFEIKDSAAGEGEWLVAQDIQGAFALTTGFSLGEQAFLQIASAYAEEPMSSIDDVAKDAIGEFLNLHNGLFLVSMSNEGIELELQPQTVQEQVTPSSGSKQLVRVHLSKGSFDLVLTERG